MKPPTTESADAMWCLVMFDLPVKTKKQRNEANRFRNLLLDEGFWMCQLSVYVMYTLTAGGSRIPIQHIKSQLPEGGEVRIIHVSDQQWSKMIRFSNGTESEGNKPPAQLTIF